MEVRFLHLTLPLPPTPVLCVKEKTFIDNNL